jgi:ectoine hydroxylase-related dioxygenase (phytanoyl-CoA dioxygenase family)
VRRGIGWHIDTAERGEDTNGMLTAWLGLTASTKQNGCLAFSAGSHDIEIPGGPKDKYTLTLTREAQSHLDPAATVLNEMAPGMASLHHFRMIHASGPNRSDARRVGFVVRYMRPDVSQATAESGQATLVRGSDRVGNFSLKPRFPMTWTG